ncbi:MAG: high frequency lysogenization protein HflD [Gammaproteobacteria bacterium]|nr:high frequency lysogenization protein HflD [Gammaproteobacteria bacterium]
MASRDSLIALAGMFQAGYLVRQIARTGMADASQFETAVKSVLNSDAKTTEDVYGGVQSIRQGMMVLSTLFDSLNKERDMEIARYVLGIAHLERKLAKDRNLLDKLSAGIERVQRQAESFGPMHENIVSNLASVYTETISTMQPRIVVAGEQGYLTNPHNAEKVRTLLLALMRSAVLWRQKGGRRWQLIFSRGKILKQAKGFLQTM